MDDGGRNPPASNQSQKELAISLTASSMINASDMISPETYHANTQRIQEAREVVRKLEVNNEAAHKNFLLDQLEKRIKDGRDAEDMLARLRNQPGLPETVQFTNNIPSNRSELILPTTATLVEVPESHSSTSYFSQAPTFTSRPSQTAHHGHHAKYKWNAATSLQPYHSDVFQHHASPPTVSDPSRQTAPSRSQLPVDPGRMGWYNTQHIPPQLRVHNPPTPAGFQSTQAQASSQSWNGYLPQAVDAVPGYYTFRIKPPYGGLSTDPSTSTYREPGILVQPTASQLSHNQPLNFTFRAQVPPQGTPVVPAIGSSKPVESQPRPIPTIISNPATVSEPPGPPQYLQQSYPRQHPEPQPQIRQHQSRSQLPQTLLQSQQPPFQRRPPQPSQTHNQGPLPLVDRALSAGVSQPHGLPSQPAATQDQAQRVTPKLQVDQATFVKHFQSAVQHGVMYLKSFWFHAKAVGITDEWLKAAVESVPRDVWQSILAQANRSGSTLDVPLPAKTPHQQVETVATSDVSAVGAPPTPTAVPLAQTASKTQQTTHSAPRHGSESYATQLQYYADQATKSALSTQVTNLPTLPPVNVVSTQTMPATPQRDVPLAHPNVRTPKDANKSTLARDILRAFGKTVQESSWELKHEPADKADASEGDQLPKAIRLQSVSGQATTARPPIVSLEAGSIGADSLLVPSPVPDARDKLHRPTSPHQSTMNSLSKEEHEKVAVIEGPIMIDLTLEDSDESIDGKGQESTFHMDTSTGAAISSQPASPTHTTNHTPLFENLSLEESSVNVAGDSDTADVRMYSPPLALITEEEMESEPLYPPSGGVEPIPLSFEALPSNTNKDPPGGQLPLFLPSPPVSPASPTIEPVIVTNNEGESRSSLKRHSLDVDKMEADTEMVPPPRVKKRRKRVYVLVPPAPSYVKKTRVKGRAMGEGMDSDTEGEGQDEELQYSHLEQILIEESKSRLLERRCRWLNCGGILNCAANLLAHVKNHAREEGLQAPFACHWASCQQQFDTEQERDRHFERHTTRLLPCPFTGCDKQFDKPVEVMEHEMQHRRMDRRELLVQKRTCQPIVPAIPTRLGPPPLRLPAHRVIPRRIAKCQISADRHAVVGPWVLWNIFSPVDLHMRKQNASMRSRPTRQPINCDVDNADPRHDDYDFLLALSSSGKDRRLDDLDSTLITLSAARGLTLWGSGGAPVTAESREDVARGSEGQSMGVGEEDAVAEMLSV